MDVLSPFLLRADGSHKEGRINQVSLTDAPLAIPSMTIPGEEEARPLYQDAEKVRQRHRPWRVKRETCEKRGIKGVKG